MLHDLRTRLSVAQEAGDTLIEVLMAVTIVAITAVALIGSVLTGISASSEHRELANGDTLLRTWADAAAQQIQRQTPPLWQGCASSYTLDSSQMPTVPTGYSIGFDFAAAPIKYWNSGSWSASCPQNNAPQLVTVVLVQPSQVKQSLSFVVRNPS